MSSHCFKNPNKYSENNALQYNFAMTILSKITFESNSRVLDIGCGDGTITNEIAQIVNNGCVIGTDLSPQMIEFASKKHINQYNLRFLQMDAAKNIFRDQFNIVTSFNCLHWVKDQEKAIMGISNAASHGAQIALLLSHKKSLYHFVLDKICSSDRWKQYFDNYISPRSFFDLSSYKTLIIQSGLELIEIGEQEMTYKFSSEDELINFFSAAGSQLGQIPELRKKEFLNDFTTEFLRQRECQDDKEIPVSFWCLQVIARKR